MKKILLAILILATGNVAYSQVVCAGISPAAIQGNYEFTVQAGCAQWPGEVDDGTWGTWTGGLDFNNPGDHIQAELMLVEDGTPGLNAQGHPISQEGCNMLTNNLTGKIAVIYRNTCGFSTKIFYAEEAGAIGVIIVNREAGLLGMLANTDPGVGPIGVDCNIPAVFIDNIDGAALINEMQNGPVEMFIGNKMGAFANDVGAVKGEFIVSPFGGASNLIYDGFTPGIQIYNYGTNDQANVTVNARIDGPNGNVYDEVVGPLAMNSGDTVSIFAGNLNDFPAFQLGLGNYADGNYTFTYTIDLGVADDAAFDNVYATTFKIQPDKISLSRLDAANMPISNSYPSNSTSEYQSCMMFQDPNAGLLGVDGMYFVPHGDTSLNDITGVEIYGYAYEWNDGWIDLDDPNYQFDPNTNDAFQNFNVASFGLHYPASNNDVDQVAFIQFDNAFQLINNQRYLFCLQTVQPAILSFGYDNSISYDGNEGILRQPVSPVHVDGAWYAAGWAGTSASSIALSIIDPATIGMTELSTLEGKAYPNPVANELTISLNASGNASLKVVDLSGKVALNADVELINGSVKVDATSLDAGVYIFNVTMENGEFAQFRVVKD